MPDPESYDSSDEEQAYDETVVPTNPTSSHWALILNMTHILRQI
jgi:hypothetical protein